MELFSPIDSIRNKLYLNYKNGSFRLPFSLFRLRIYAMSNFDTTVTRSSALTHSSILSNDRKKRKINYTPCQLTELIKVMWWCELLLLTALLCEWRLPENKKPYSYSRKRGSTSNLSAHLQDKYGTIMTFFDRKFFIGVMFFFGKIYNLKKNFYHLLIKLKNNIFQYVLLCSPFKFTLKQCQQQSPLYRE